MAPPLDIMLHLGVARCTRLVSDKYNNPQTDENDESCWLWTGSRNTDGYPQVWSKKNQDLNNNTKAVAFSLHRISFVASTGRNVQNHCSHLCDNRNCFNPDHLADETEQQNNSRKGCPGDIYCSTHHHLICPTCPHRPKCIRPARDDVRCCLDIKESAPEIWHSSPPPRSSQTSSGHGPQADVLLRSDPLTRPGAYHLLNALRDPKLDDEQDADEDIKEIPESDSE